MRHRLTRALLALLACSGASAFGLLGSETSSAASFAGTLNVCIVEDYSGFLASGNLEAKKGNVAWASYINAHGGVVAEGKHYKINFIYLDDADNAAQDVTQVQACVQNDHPLAMIMDTAADQQGGAYLKSQKLAILGAGSYDTTSYGVYHNFFPLSITQPVFPWAAASGLAQEKLKKVAVVSCVESPTCFTGVPIFAKYAQLLGMDSVYTGQAPAASPSYTSTCLAAKAAGVQGIYMASTEPVAIRLADDCAQQGYHPVIIEGGGDLDVSAWSDQALDGMLEIVSSWSWEYESKVPSIAKVMQQGIRLIPNANYTDRSALIGGWFMGGVIQRALSLIKGPVNAANFLVAMTKFHKETIGGLAPVPLSFRASGPQPLLACAVIDRMHGGKSTAFTKYPTATCVPSKDIALGGITAAAGSQQP